jgi:hypothetical protein
LQAYLKDFENGCCPLIKSYPLGSLENLTNIIDFMDFLMRCQLAMECLKIITKNLVKSLFLSSKPRCKWTIVVTQAKFLQKPTYNDINKIKLPSNCY